MTFPSEEPQPWLSGMCVCDVYVGCVYVWVGEWEVCMWRVCLCVCVGGVHVVQVHVYVGYI